MEVDEIFVDKRKDSTVLLTGAGGFFSKEIINQLLKENYEIYALTSNIENLRERFKDNPNIHCFSNHEIKEIYFPWKKIQTLIHCAFTRSSLGYELVESLNFTNEIFNMAAEKEVNSIINISSRSVYGQNKEIPWTEATSPAPDTTYALAKYTSEILLNNLKRFTGNKINITNIRMAGLIGPGLDQRIVSKFVYNALKNHKIKIIGGEQIFSFLDVKDAAVGITALLKNNPSSWKSVYNLGSNKCYSIVELAELVVDASKTFSSDYVQLELEKKDISFNASMDSSLFYKDTGWQPDLNMKNSIKLIFEYYKET